jgi:RimJ/RimL family protein N-acetyltransferase
MRNLAVREMALSEADLVIDYFLGATSEHLELMGVDPSRLPTREQWRERFVHDYGLPIEQRPRIVVIWLMDGRPIGYSSADKITFGEQANMHLHVIDPAYRRTGVGTECVKATVNLYFNKLRLKRLFCEPNAFNVAPNRTLQRAGFRYVKTHMTVPGPINYHQAVTRWVIER